MAARKDGPARRFFEPVRGYVAVTYVDNFCIVAVNFTPGA